MNQPQADSSGGLSGGAIASLGGIGASRASLTEGPDAPFPRKTGLRAQRAGTDADADSDTALPRPASRILLDRET